MVVMVGCCFDGFSVVRWCGVVVVCGGVVVWWWGGGNRAVKRWWCRAVGLECLKLREEV